VDQTLASLAPVESFLDTALPRFDDRDKRLLAELVLGTLRWVRRLDHILAAASHRDFDEIEPALRAPLRVGAYQLLFLDRVPAHAAVHEAVEQARQATHRGGASFTNAVLRRIARSPRLADWPVREEDPARRLSIEWSHPEFLVRRWLERFGPERTAAVLEADNRAKLLHLLAFRDRGGRELLAERLIDLGLEVEPSRWSPLGLVVHRGDPLHTEPFDRGDLYIQDEASQIAALLPPPAPGERVLDVAASPGGKSFALMAWEPSVRVVLADVSPARLALLRANLKRLRRSAALALQDGGSPALTGPWDRVVVDLPCTGTGTFRKHPELKWRLRPEEVDRLAHQGLRLLRGSAPRVAPGGLLVAITCSLEREENEDVVGRFLDAHPEFEPLPLEGRIPGHLEDFIRGPGLWRIFPAGYHDGFTVQVLRRGHTVP
jgi:16S rRNA (cytosine967-C5)-methyltransferase